MYAVHENINNRNIILRGYKRTDDLCKSQENTQDPVLISKMLHNLGKILYTVEFLYEDSMPMESNLLTDINTSDNELLEQLIEIEQPNGITISEIILTAEYNMGFSDTKTHIKKRFDITNEYLQLLLMFKRNNKQKFILPYMN